MSSTSPAPQLPASGTRVSALLASRLARAQHQNQEPTTPDRTAFDNVYAYGRLPFSIPSTPNAQAVYNVPVHGLSPDGYTFTDGTLTETERAQCFFYPYARVHLENKEISPAVYDTTVRTQQIQADTCSLCLEEITECVYPMCLCNCRLCPGCFNSFAETHNNGSARCMTNSHHVDLSAYRKANCEMLSSAVYDLKRYRYKISSLQLRNYHYEKARLHNLYLYKEMLADALTVRGAKYDFEFSLSDGWSAPMHVFNPNFKGKLWKRDEGQSLFIVSLYNALVEVLEVEVYGEGRGADFNITYFLYEHYYSQQVAPNFYFTYMGNGLVELERLHSGGQYKLFFRDVRNRKWCTFEIEIQPRSVIIDTDFFEYFTHNLADFPVSSWYHLLSPDIADEYTEQDITHTLQHNDGYLTHGSIEGEHISNFTTDDEGRLREAFDALIADKDPNYYAQFLGDTFGRPNYYPVCIHGVDDAIIRMRKLPDALNR